ncbi:ATP-grasp domain-containing protein [uncultured Desulfuromusa sp.]|uniref:D-alanine--D-alanine ligase family protein n=1 Tax=uncultured Desulfuromusa sp. TaxID=219183 RepID=UPI002AA77128|nr:ATP-grasp domain-containing protein [uncultured Desulfuromusa sp.]
MRIAVCYNQTPEYSVHGESRDRIADNGSHDQAKAVVKALQQLGHEPELIPLADKLMDFLRRLERFSPDLAFNLCEGFWGNAHLEMNVAGVFELLQLPFSGSPSLCLGLTQDKLRTKSLLLQQGLPTPPFCLAEIGNEHPVTAGMNFPLIVKPPFEDASQGIEAASVVDTLLHLKRRIRYIHEVYRQPALIEEFIEGRELNVAILGSKDLTVLPAAEITFASSLLRKIVCFDSKWSPQSSAYKGTIPVCPAKLTEAETQLVSKVSLLAFKLFGCRDYARIDIRLRNQTPYILEVNANPDITPDAGLARAAGAAGLAYAQLIEQILEGVSKRKERPHAQTAI